MKWMIGVDELDAAQRKAIEAILKSPQKNHWIKGFAGTGKTIVLTHVLKRLAANKSNSICFATYTHALKEMVESGLSPRERSAIKTTTFPGLKKIRGSFDFIVADEVQDAGRDHLDALTNKAESLIFAADPAQKIYRFSIPAHELTTRVEPLTEHRLRTIHRINLPVYTVATKVYPDSEFSPGKAPDDDREPVLLMNFTSRSEESQEVLNEATRLAKKGSPSAILVSNNESMVFLLTDIAKKKSWGRVPEIRSEGSWDDPFGEVNQYLESNNSSLQLFGSRSGSLEASGSRKLVYLMTYHNAKGLEFPNVFMPYLTDSAKLDPMGGSTASSEERFFFVAATRAKERLCLSYHGHPHRFIEVLNDLGEDTLRNHISERKRY